MLAAAARSWLLGCEAQHLDESECSTNTILLAAGLLDWWTA